MSSLRWLQRGVKDAPVLVCIHGWAANSAVWQPIVDCIDVGVVVVDLPGFGVGEAGTLVYSDFIAILAGELQAFDLSEQNTFLVGWSLGGQVATSLAAYLSTTGRHIAGLVTLASNPCFVAKNDWPNAMPGDTFLQFCQGFSEQPALTIKRFNALQASGSLNLRALRASQKALLPLAPSRDSSTHALWLNVLNWLQQDTRTALKQLQKPQLHILAQDDALVPATISLGHFGEVLTLSNTSHCLPLDAPTKVARAINIFIKTHKHKALDKRKVAAAFSLAAKRYDAFARVQKIVAKQVLHKSPITDNAIILDVGSGTGALTEGVFKYAQPAHVIALDIAQGMLQFAQSHTQHKAVSFIAADAESLPIASGSIDGIMSSLAIQWCERPELLMKELYRVLKPGGWIVIATLGPGTLGELKAAWHAVDDCVHVNAFASAALLEQASAAAGFDGKLTQQTECCDYPSLMPLLKELKAIGAHNSHVNAPAGLMTKARLKQLEQHYPVTLHQKAPIVASYDVFYLELKK